MFRFIIKGIFFSLIFFMLLAGCRQNEGKTGKELSSTGLEERNALRTRPTPNAGETTVIVEDTNANSINLKSDPRLSTFKMVSTRPHHTIAIKMDGSLWTWGENSYGQLGDGTTEDRLSPVRIGADNDWASVSVGRYYSVALKTDGSLWAWGENRYGQLGDGTADNRLSPVRIGADYDWASVSAGDFSTIAIKTDGSMWGWGSNIADKLGIGTTDGFKNTPTRIGQDNDWSFVSAGDGGQAVVAIKTDGSLWEWGYILGGPNGIDKREYITVTRPTRVGTATNWAAASAGSSRFRIAIKTDGTLWTWGDNDLLNLIDKDSFNSLVQIGTDTDWLSVSANDDNTMAVKTDGSLWAWGTLGFDGLGYEFELLLEYGNVPARIWGDTKWTYISASYWHAFAIMTDGSLWAWGKRTHYADGMLGDGTTTDRLSPVQIGFVEESENVDGIFK